MNRLPLLRALAPSLAALALAHTATPALATEPQQLYAARALADTDAVVAQALVQWLSHTAQAAPTMLAAPKAPAVLHEVVARGATAATSAATLLAVQAR